MTVEHAGRHDYNFYVAGAVLCTTDYFESRGVPPSITPTPTPTWTPTLTSTLTPTATSTPSLTPTPTSTPTLTPTSTPTPAPTPTFTPIPPPFASIPVDGPPADHPDHLHGDLNLSLRGYEPTTAFLGLVDYTGATDPDSVQLPGLFIDSRTPGFVAACQVYDWNWACGEHGCRGDLLTYPDVTLIGMVTALGEPISIPTRNAEIYGGGFKAMVLYAEEGRITLGYTRHDSVAFGYAIHIENVSVDPDLLALYRTLNAEGRGMLPALRNGETLGTALGQEIGVAVRDRGTFMDPRSRKDWWKGH